MADEDVIRLDYSTISTFLTCREKCRLQYVEDWQSKAGSAPLVFGGAFHEAIAIYHVAKVLKEMAPEAVQAIALRRNTKTNEPTLNARAAHLILGGKSLKDAAITSFVRLAKAGDVLPVSADSEERRSIERGVYLVEAYIEKWKDEHFVNYIRPDTGEPYVEIGFSVYLMTWKGRDVMYIGRMDRIMRNRIDNALYIFELKTTRSGLSNFETQTRPNHQLSGYMYAAKQLLQRNTAGVIWDSIYISDRKVGGKYPLGINMETDFSRIETRRSQSDLDDWLSDMQDAAEEFLTLRDSGKARWIRSAPTACYMYGGCMFRDVCSASSLGPRILEQNFRKEKWEPYANLDD